MAAERPNILFFHVDNLGMGELGCYGGGIVRGAETARTDAFAREGLQLWHYIAEPQCTPSRSALMTGRYAIRSGTHTVPRGGGVGLVAWERTMGDILSDAGYATACFGKWHLGAEDGRWPTDHGFDEWYGPPRSYDESRWDENPWYRPDRDLRSFMHEGTRAAGVRQLDDEPLTLDRRRDVDVEYTRRALAFLRKSVDEERPFYLYFNHSLLHVPRSRAPSSRARPATATGPTASPSWTATSASCSMRSTSSASPRHDRRARRRQRRREPADREGQLGRLRGLVLHVLRGRAAHAVPDQVARQGRPGACVQRDRPPDRHVHDAARLGRMPDPGRPRGRRRRPARVLRGLTGESSREGCLVWVGDVLHAVKWQHFKVAYVRQRYLDEAPEVLTTPVVVNLLTDPKERESWPVLQAYNWVYAHVRRLRDAYDASVRREPPIPAGAPIGHVPERDPASG